MTWSIVGKKFYQKVSTREDDDGNGWTVMLDYRTLKTHSKRPLKLPLWDWLKPLVQSRTIRCVPEFNQFVNFLSVVTQMGLFEIQIICPIEYQN